MNLRLWKLIHAYKTWYLGKTPSVPYRHIVQIGDPVLRRKAEKVDPSAIKSEQMGKLLVRMCEMLKKTRAAGISAPQVGVSLQVFAMQFPTKKKYDAPDVYDIREMEYMPLQVWINPEMKVLDYKKIPYDEGCESMRGFTAEIPRFYRVLLTGLDADGEKQTLEAKGWTARIIQHEMDHLNGKMFTDCMIPSTLACTNWYAINRYQGQIYHTYMPGKR